MTLRFALSLARWCLEHPRQALTGALTGIVAAADRDAAATERAARVIDDICREIRRPSKWEARPIEEAVEAVAAERRRRAN